MTNLFSYQKDGADRQARCVLALIQAEDQYMGQDEEQNIQIARWENCREQGYVVVLRTPKGQLNIAFFEHRNSDDICAVMWEQFTINSPTIDSAKFGDIYADKWDVSHTVGYGEYQEMANWIYGELFSFVNK